VLVVPDTLVNPLEDSDTIFVIVAVTVLVNIPDELSESMGEVVNSELSLTIIDVDMLPVGISVFDVLYDGMDEPLTDRELHIDSEPYGVFVSKELLDGRFVLLCVFTGEPDIVLHDV
jgi:ABC-type Na+ efflux pump permease subunit